MDYAVYDSSPLLCFRSTLHTIPNADYSRYRIDNKRHLFYLVNGSGKLHGAQRGHSTGSLIFKQT